MQFMANLGPARLILRTLVAMCWLTAGSWIVFILVKKDQLKIENIKEHEIFQMEIKIPFLQNLLITLSDNANDAEVIQPIA